MDTKRSTVYSETGAVYWDSDVRKFIVSPDYYHRQFSGDTYVNEGEAAKTHTFNVATGQTLKFAFNRRGNTRWMNVSIPILGAQTYIWGDPHWYYKKAPDTRRWTWAYELPDVSSYWFDILGDVNDPDDDISIEFQCQLERWNLSVVTKTLVYKVEDGVQVRYVFNGYGMMQKQVLQ